MWEWVQTAHGFSHQSIQFTHCTPSLTLNCPLEEGLTGLTGGHTVVGTRGWVSTHLAQSLQLSGAPWHQVVTIQDGLNLQIGQCSDDCSPLVNENGYSVIIFVLLQFWYFISRNIVFKTCFLFFTQWLKRYMWKPHLNWKQVSRWHLWTSSTAGISFWWRVRHRSSTKEDAGVKGKRGGGEGGDLVTGEEAWVWRPEGGCDVHRCEVRLISGRAVGGDREAEEEEEKRFSSVRSTNMI